MIDDFNRAIETLSLNHNPDEMESNILQRRNLRGDSTQQKGVGPLGAKQVAPLPRRASTGQMELENLRENRITKAIPNKASAQLSTVENALPVIAAKAQPSVQDVEALRKTKALMVTNSAIEQQLKSQQQILIQQQQQFLQIQIEQQRLQSQMNEQLSEAAKLEHQKLEEEKKKVNLEPLINRDAYGVRSSPMPDPRYRQDPSTVNTAVNTDNLYEQGYYDRNRHDRPLSSVLKQDKQVSTTPPPSSIHSTPTGQVGRSLSQTGQHSSTGTNSRMSGGAGDSEAMRPRVASASSSQSSTHRRTLPQPGEETACPMPTSVTGYHHQQQQHAIAKSARVGQPSSVTALNIAQSAGSSSPILGRKGAAIPQPPTIQNAIAKAAASVSMAYPSSILNKKPTNTTANSAARSVTGTNPLSATLGLSYLDLDTKNVSFEEDKSRRRTLPSVPPDEVETSVISTRKFIKERLNGKLTLTLSYSTDWLCV